MIRVIVSGAAGHMGRILREKLSASDAFVIVGLVDPFGEECAENLSACTADADVVIDFSNHLGTEALLSEDAPRYREYVYGGAWRAVDAVTGKTVAERADLSAGFEVDVPAEGVRLLVFEKKGTR